MKKYSLIIFTIIATMLITSCSKKEEFLENEKKLRDDYIKKSKIDFSLSNGLYYYISDYGDSIKINKGEELTITYKGTLINGQSFVSDDTLSFTAGSNDVIEGWKIASTLIFKKSKGTLIIPSSLAYKKYRVGTIPPYSTLIFKFEVIN